MEFGILFASHPNTETKPCPHRDVHRRVTCEVLRADALGIDGDRALASLELFAAEVAPSFADPAQAARASA